MLKGILNSYEVIRKKLERIREKIAEMKANEKKYFKNENETKKS